ncbi:MAG: hypothetical protein ABSF83_01505, partial [Nitrososphaerales archaeon]
MLVAELPVLAPVSGVTGTTQPETATFTFDVIQLDRYTLTANFGVFLLGGLKPANMTIINTVNQDNCGQDACLSIGVAQPMYFDSWQEEGGVFQSDQSQQVDLQGITPNFPHDSIRLRLWVGTNIELNNPIVSSSIPTYQVIANMSD